MDAREFAEWEIYDRCISPGEPERGDYQAALVAHIIAEAHKGKKGRKSKVEDFLLQFDAGSIVRQDADTIKTKLMQWKGVNDKKFEAPKEAMKKGV